MVSRKTNEYAGWYPAKLMSMRDAIPLHVIYFVALPDIQLAYCSETSQSLSAR